MTQQRDAFISEIHKAALRDSNIVFISADFGAPALDKFREELPAQFVHAGISEQNAVNVAVGLAVSGKKVYLYWMSPFFLRCFEQLKLAAFHGVPITVVSVGAGLSYAGSGPTHYATEDIACFRTLVNTELYTASTANMAAALARQSVTANKMQIIRLERGELPELYADNMDVRSGYVRADPSGIPTLACGYLVHYLSQMGRKVFDVYRINPLPPRLVLEIGGFNYVYTYEEQYAAGGFSSALLEALNRDGLKTRVLAKTLPDRAIYENGTRNELISWLL